MCIELLFDTIVTRRTNVRDELIKSVEYGELLDMMYLSIGGEISKQSIQVILVGDVSFKSHCHLRKSKRTVTTDNALVLVPVHKRESMVI